MSDCQKQVSKTLLYNNVLYTSETTAAPSGPPTHMSVDAVFSRSIVLSWQYPLKEDRNGAIAGFKVHLIESKSNLVTGLETENTTILIEGDNVIKPFTLYYCKVAAFTMAGVGPYSEIISIRTIEDGKLYIIQVNKNILRIKKERI